MQGRPVAEEEKVEAEREDENDTQRPNQSEIVIVDGRNGRFIQSAAE